MTDDNLFQMLDEVATPAVGPVDLTGLYRTAAAERDRTARRWKLGAIAAGALAVAAGVYAWTPRPAPGPDPAMLARLDSLEKQLADADRRRIDADDLLLTLAADVADRDGRRAADMAELRTRLLALQAEADRRQREADRTTSALYSAVFDKPKTEGVNP